MRCPSCRKPATEHDSACVECGFTLEALNQHMGIPPVLNGPVADVAGILPKNATRAAGATIRMFEHRFPQVSFVTVLMEMRADLPMAMQAFWLFNRGSLFSAVEKGGDNHGVMLLLDTRTARASVMIGYGLEPYVSDATLELCLAAAARSVEKQQYGAAIESFVRELERQFVVILDSLPRMFGFEAGGRWRDCEDDEPLVTATAEEDLF